MYHEWNWINLTPLFGVEIKNHIITLQLIVFVAWLLGKAVHHSNKYSLFTVPASALILFSPTVAPANPWRVPREVKEFMAAPAVELAVDAATKRKKKKNKAKLRP